jgi:hypothetical protein
VRFRTQLFLRSTASHILYQHRMRGPLLCRPEASFRSSSRLSRNVNRAQCDSGTLETQGTLASRISCPALSRKFAIALNRDGIAIGLMQSSFERQDRNGSQRLEHRWQRFVERSTRDHNESLGKKGGVRSA